MTATVDALLTRYLGLGGNKTPEPERLPFEIGDHVVGSLIMTDAQLLAETVPGVELNDDSLQVLPVCAPDAPAALGAIANALRDAGRIHHWRDEQLPVCSDSGELVGSVERACVRALGVRTFAVHLNGRCHSQDGPDSTPDAAYQVWLQRRAADKPVDPGKLDTLAGGLIGMEADGKMENFRIGLIREVHEEAGLLPEQYSHPEHVGTQRFSWQLPEGYFEEDCIVFHAVLNPDVQPRNLDGEVSEFMRVGRSHLLELIDTGELTETAAIASLLALKHALNE